jgi:hypothetical protein
MRLLSKIMSHSIEPIRVIEWVIAVFTFIGGVYIFTPLYQASVAQNGLTGVALLLNHPVMVMIFGALLVVSSLFVMLGLWKNKPQFRSIGWFNIFLARSFQILGGWLVTGLLPITWIFLLTITTVVIVLWATARVEVKRDV